MATPVLRGFAHLFGGSVVEVPSARVGTESQAYALCPVLRPKAFLQSRPILSIFRHIVSLEFLKSPHLFSLANDGVSLQTFIGNLGEEWPDS